MVEPRGAIDRQTHLIVLLGGEAGLRCGEMIALEWRDVDLGKRQLCVQRSDWNGQVTTPKGGRLRYVPLTSAVGGGAPRASAPSEHAGAVSDDGTPFTRQQVQYRIKRAARTGEGDRRRSHPASHVLFAPGDAGAPAAAIQELAGHSELGMTQRYMHLSPAALDARFACWIGREATVGQRRRSRAWLTRNV